MRAKTLQAFAFAVFCLCNATAQATSHRMVPCSFPDGWNPEDHRRKVEGAPPDQRHQCMVDSQGKILDSHGRQTN